jgi:phosphoadenosine phosphosulfate reductase
MAQVLKDSLLSLQTDCIGIPIPAVLNRLLSLFPQAVTFSTSFSNEDQVITDLISRSNTAISIFTLDTGRLFNETYTTWGRTLERYNIPIKAFYPDKKQLQVFVTENGPNAFYGSVELRKKCCYIRKVVPLRKALEGNAVWITGLRAEHSPARESLSVFEWDEANQVIKYNPLLHWTTAEVKDHISRYNVPYNPLHDKGFVSIGCAPCTRAVKDGEDIRAGRWWWEDNSKKECGLHAPNPFPK